MLVPQAFKEQKYPEAVKFYTEALKRGPPAVNPEAYKVFSNRSACFTKLGAYPDGLKVLFSPLFPPMMDLQIARDASSGLD